jgi:hypothetical protein
VRPLYSADVRLEELEVLIVGSEENVKVVRIGIGGGGGGIGATEITLFCLNLLVGCGIT